MLSIILKNTDKIWKVLANFIIPQIAFFVQNWMLVFTQYVKYIFYNYWHGSRVSLSPLCSYTHFRLSFFLHGIKQFVKLTVTQVLSYFLIIVVIWIHIFHLCFQIFVIILSRYLYSYQAVLEDLNFQTVYLKQWVFDFDINCREEVANCTIFKLCCIFFLSNELINIWFYRLFLI